MNIKLLSLDIETTGLLPEQGQILSVGLVDYDTGKSAYWQIEHALYSVTSEALRVNRIDLATWKGCPLQQASYGIRQFIEDNYANKIVIPLGLNVGSFDMTWMRKYMPTAVEVIGHRSLDLNSLIASESIDTNAPFQHLKDLYTDLAYSKVKNSMVVSDDLDSHHALFDAYTNCAMLSLIHDTTLPWLV